MVDVSVKTINMDIMLYQECSSDWVKATNTTNTSLSIYSPIQTINLCFGMWYQKGLISFISDSP